MAARPEHEESSSTRQELLALRQRVAQLEEERRLLYKDYYDLLTSIDRLQAETIGRLPKHSDLYTQLLAARRWLHLEFREHPWRVQLYVKGRNLTVGQLVSAVKANCLTAEEAAEDFDLSVDAIHEAVQYANENAALIEFEAARERALLSQAEDHRAAGTIFG
jgi:uncharacterized protein (DUF433 family)